MTDRASRKALEQLAKTILRSPDLQRQLCDRLYALLQAELREQNDRQPYRTLR